MKSRSLKLATHGLALAMSLSAAFGGTVGVAESPDYHGDIVDVRVAFLIQKLFASQVTDTVVGPQKHGRGLESTGGFQIRQNRADVLIRLHP